MNKLTRNKFARRNLDTLGNQWRLAPYGRREIDQSASKLFEIQAELLGLAALIRAYSENSEHAEFFGVGLSLERLSTRIRKVSNRLNATITDQLEE